MHRPGAGPAWGARGGAAGPAAADKGGRARPRSASERAIKPKAQKRNEKPDSSWPERGPRSGERRHRPRGTGGTKGHRTCPGRGERRGVRVRGGDILRGYSPARGERPATGAEVAEGPRHWDCALPCPAAPERAATRASSPSAGPRLRPAPGPPWPLPPSRAISCGARAGAARPRWGGLPLQVPASPPGREERGRMGRAGNDSEGRWRPDGAGSAPPA